jgi:O-antigen/teichoic acid export membrane protein
LRSIAHKVLKAPSIKASWYYAVSGVFFAVATLLMARVMSPASFGVVALAIAISNVGIAAAPAGMSGVRLRHDVRTDTALLAHALVIIGAIGVSLGFFGSTVYGLDPVVVLAIVAAVVAGGMALLGLIPFQKARRFSISVPFGQVGNAALLVSAGLMLLWPEARVAWLPTAFVALAFGAVAIWSWRNQWPQPGSGPSFGRPHWHDGLQFTVMSAADQVMWQLERLLIPILLTLGDLAVFAVVGAIAVAPYHVLAAGAGATLIPRLQAAPSSQQRLRLISHETLVMLALSVLGGLLILLLMPPLVDWYLGSKVVVTHGLLIAAIAGGVARILAAVARAPAVAFCSSAELRRISLGSWLAVALGVVCAWLLAGLGLIGLIAGVTIGWLARGAIAIAVAWHHLASESPPVTAAQ